MISKSANRGWRSSFTSILLTKRGVLFGLTCAAALALSLPAQAAFVTGTLQTTSGFTETATALDFCTTASIPCSNTPTGTFDIGMSGTGDFAAPYANDPNGVTVTNLNNVNAPVGTVLAGNGIVFLAFNPSAALPTPDIQLWIKEVLPGVGETVGNCSTAVTATCTPTGSAVTFTNVGGGNSSATISAMGEAERISTTEFDPLKLVFTAQFNSPYQTVFSNFLATGSISSSESGTFTATAVPEPGTMLSLGLLVGLLFAAHRFRAKWA